MWGKGAHSQMGRLHVGRLCTLLAGMRRLTAEPVGLQLSGVVFRHTVFCTHSPVPRSWAVRGLTVGVIGWAGSVSTPARVCTQAWQPAGRPSPPTGRHAVTAAAVVTVCATRCHRCGWVRQRPRLIGKRQVRNLLSVDGKAVARVSRHPAVFSRTKARVPHGNGDVDRRPVRRFLNWQKRTERGRPSAWCTAGYDPTVPNCGQRLSCRSVAKGPLSRKDLAS